MYWVQCAGRLDPTFGQLIACSGRVFVIQPELSFHQLADLEFLDLACDGHRKLCDETDIGRRLEVSDLAITEILDLIFGDRLTGLGNNPRAKLLAISFARQTDHLDV